MQPPAHLRTHRLSGQTHYIGRRYTPTKRAQNEAWERQAKAGAQARGGAEDDGGYLQMDDILINDRVFETAKNLRAKQVDVSIVPRTADLNGTGQRSSEIDPLVVELKQGDGQVVGVDNSHLGVG